MKSIDLEMLESLTQEILGKMAFMFVEPVECAAGLEDSLGACVEFVGPGGGAALILQGSSEFLKDLASGLLGLENHEVDTNVEGLHSLKEIANVLAGEIIRELGGEHAQFNLGIPFALENAHALTSHLSCDFDAMGQSFRASLVLTPCA